MLYTPFRKALRRYARAARAFGGHTLPEFLVEPDPDHAALLELEDATRRRVRVLRRRFPETPPGGFGENGPDFGPVLHPDDMRVAVSVLLPLALTLTESFPTESYGPVSFLREKCEVLTATIEVYAGWRAYSVGPARTRWQGFPPQAPAGAIPELQLVSSEARHLATLLANISSSASRCRQAVEFQLGESFEGL